MRARVLVLPPRLVCADDDDDYYDDDDSMVLPMNFRLSPYGSEHWKEERYWQASLYTLSQQVVVIVAFSTIILLRCNWRRKAIDKRRRKLNLKLRILKTNSNI
jgi:hypothetical protein